MGCIDDHGVQAVAKLLGELAPNNIKGPASVMAFQVFDVFQQKRGWAMGLQDA